MQSTFLKYFSNERNNYTYLSLLTLSGATYIDTGYYYCTPKHIESKLIKYYKKLYIFIEGKYLKCFCLVHFSNKMF